MLVSQSTDELIIFSSLSWPPSGFTCFSVSPLLPSPGRVDLKFFTDFFCPALTAKFSNFGDSGGRIKHTPSSQMKLYKAMQDNLLECKHVKKNDFTNLDIGR